MECRDCSVLLPFNSTLLSLKKKIKKYDYKILHLKRRVVLPDLFIVSCLFILLISNDF